MGTGTLISLTNKLNRLEAHKNSKYKHKFSKNIRMDAGLDSVINESGEQVRPEKYRKPNQRLLR